MAGNVFQNPQQPAGARATPLGSGRLQNGKLGSGSSWTFGVPMGGAPGLSGNQNRANNPAASSFAQATGASQSQQPLDLSDFPSLSNNAPQQQQNVSSHAIWSNTPSLRGNHGRGAEHTPVQRPQGQGSTPQPPSASQPTQQPLSQHHQSQALEEGTSPSPQFAAGTEEFRFGNQSSTGQQQGNLQALSGSIDEFPPLGGGPGDIGLDRRAGLMQNNIYGGNTNGNGFPGSLNGGRNSLVGPLDGQQDRTALISAGDRMTAPGSSASQHTLGNALSHVQRSAQSAFRAGGINDPQQTIVHGQQPPRSGLFGVDPMESSQSPQQRPEPKRLAQMTDIERFGIQGLLAMINSDHPDHSPLALGHDLNALGLDLRTDDLPIYPTFAGPFAEPNSRPIIPDFTLPSAYKVTNVPPLREKMISFSDDTLFAIFYQYPRDILQEDAAGELFAREWRWNIKLRQWMRKDEQFGNTQRISEKEERAYYIFFDVNNWRKERREILLHYDDLDMRHQDLRQGQHAGPSLS
ncbi:hypothetical protein W97_07520 [Coniosporium apollinis CBS 100218]|uniref:NOT2/NOT3/NOT5 C-terminal domain-containing protein n=1 Tax=Coniosporium apollinis (strain CBS 100218) TaxID=1168221 RepID=R7Z269_CONA1|nr:uncharacterized protein W97_07520 [Coniosporium apollinis CBS 100218]EON68262.1 hypothetical protein W97_07520 [Coniosporium apollinis CBS 100218]